MNSFLAELKRRNVIRVAELISPSKEDGIKQADAAYEFAGFHLDCSNSAA